MRKVLLSIVLLSIPPVLSIFLFCAHLLFHGMPIPIAAAPLAALVLLWIQRTWSARLLAIVQACFALEWARAGFELVMRRLEAGGSIHPALEIMAGVTLFTLLSAWCAMRRVR